VIRAEAVATLLQRLVTEGLQPDLVVVHPGRGVSRRQSETAAS